jgi:glycosyltransferase involved in cell wall biosynthesis
MTGPDLDRSPSSDSDTDPTHSDVPSSAGGERRLRVLFFVEGNTDIRFVSGLSEVFDLTLAVPAAPYEQSGLKRRVAEAGIRLRVHELRGGRLAFQFQSLAYLWRNAGEFDVVLSQEVLRGSLSANIVGAVRGVPVVMYMDIPPIEYFRWRRRRGQIGWARSAAGELVIRALMRVNGRLSTRTLAVGGYLREMAGRYTSSTGLARYCGVDTSVYRPATMEERASIRRTLELPAGKFVVLFSSRISHEKDPETALRAMALVKSRGLDAVILNLSGGYRDFVELADRLGVNGEPDDPVAIGRPAVHPMLELADYYRAADAVVQASHEEGCGFSPLESLACGTPVVATAVGGLEINLPGYAQLVPPRDPEAMADAVLWIAANREAAREQALRGREFVVAEWSRAHAFAELREALVEVRAEWDRRR